MVRIHCRLAFSTTSESVTGDWSNTWSANTDCSNNCFSFDASWHGIVAATGDKISETGLHATSGGDGPDGSERKGSSNVGTEKTEFGGSSNAESERLVDSSLMMSTHTNWAA